MVQQLFEAYLRLGSVKALTAWAKSENITTKIRNRSNGSIRSGGEPFSRGNLHALLSYRAYIGEVAHKGNVYPGEQDAIIGRDLWEAVQVKLTEGRSSPRGRSASGESSLLTGLLFDETGDRLTPSHATKNGRRYRYYVSRRLIETDARDPSGWRLPAQEIEGVVITTLIAFVNNPREIMSMMAEQSLTATILKQWDRGGRELSERIQQSKSEDRRSLVAGLVSRITIAANSLVLQIRRETLLHWIGGKDRFMQDDIDISHHEISIPISLQRRGVEARLILGDSQQNTTVDPLLVSTIANAHAWFGDFIAAGKSNIKGIAKDQGLGASEITRLLPLAFLAPDIVDAIIAGRQPPALTTQRLKRLGTLPLGWHQQWKTLGFQMTTGQ